MSSLELETLPEAPPTPEPPQGKLSRLLYRREVGFLIFVAALVVTPMIFGGSYSMYQVNVIVLAIMGAVGLNLLTGLAGQVSMGNAAFMGIGAFAVVILNRWTGAPFVICVPVAVIVSGLIGLMIGFPAMRLKGLYLLLSTLGLYYIFSFFATRYQSGTVGATGFELTNVSVFGWQPLSQNDWYYLIAPFAAVCMFVAANLAHTRAGRNWAAIRYSETVAAGIGVPVQRYKLIAFVVSSMMIGLEGALLAYFLGFVASDTWDIQVSMSYVAMIILGGLGSLTGSVIGAVIVTLLPTLIANFLATQHGLPTVITSNAGPVSTFVYGLLIVVALLVAPRGAMGILRSAWALITKDRSSPGSRSEHADA
jgi:branched-chain amino acid transport system permease protein